MGILSSILVWAHPRLRRGPGYTLQFLSFACGKASGISASIPCAAQAAEQLEVTAQ
jgi:hypothetical protein